MPEPATITLLGTGFIAMGVRYVRTKYRSMKPKFDRVAGLILLVAFAPVIGLAALLVKLTSRGPAFYKQERVGEQGRIFNMIKIRTMRHDAETESGPVWAEEKDSRVTPVGAFLRRTHLDELPQLVNVIRGEMSLVGPRPERPYFVERLRESIPGYDRRLAVKPGITGLAQVRVGYDHAVRDVRRKVKLDLMYARRMCWWVDFVIIVRTVGKFVDLGERRG
jgi:lipopolysaccharide/colanic/teichoic acid biosynthesis glycosyltransferase